MLKSVLTRNCLLQTNSLFKSKAVNKNLIYCSQSRAAHLKCFSLSYKKFIHSDASNKKASNDQSVLDQKARSHDKKNCWGCNTPLTKTVIFCQRKDCHLIQPIDSANNYFDILTNSKIEFDLDLKNLRSEFIKLQQAAHPDINTLENSEIQSISQLQSTWLNKAYETLKQPLSRAKYILKLRGKEISEEDKSTDQEFLFLIMELHEKIELMSEEEHSFSAVKSLIDDLISEKIKELSASFRSQNIDSFHNKSVELQYLCRLKESL